MSAVELERVTKAYGKHLAVNDLSLTVPRGSLYGFIGPNGSGKTTTIRMILRIIHPDEGQIRVLGHSEAAAANDRLGYLPEERGLYKKLSVRRMLRYYASLKSMPRLEIEPAITKWLRRFELEAWADKKIETLSKGMSQKVQFIASVISRPSLLILDEPFSGLDPVNTEVIRSAILDLKADGTTIIFSTHDMGVAENMCDSVFMIYKGNKVLDGSLVEVKHQYAADSIHLRWDGSSSELYKIPEITKVIDMGSYQELQFDGDPQSILHELTGKGNIDLFKVTHPSLHDIFIRIASPESTESESTELLEMR